VFVARGAVCRPASDDLPRRSGERLNNLLSPSSDPVESEVRVGYPVVHFEINTSRGSELAQFYSTAFEWETSADGDDYVQINTRGVCAGTGAPGIDGGIGPSEHGDDFVTFYVQVPDVGDALRRVVELGGDVDMPVTEAGAVVIAVFRDPAGNRVGLVRG
jgi:predicted enzyme related to lactoylglutathione lyase